MTSDPGKDRVSMQIGDLAFAFGGYARVHRCKKDQRDGVIGGFFAGEDKVAKTCEKYYTALEGVFNSYASGNCSGAKAGLTEVVGNIDADLGALRKRKHVALFFLESQKTVREDITAFEGFSRKASGILTLMA